MDGYSLIYLEMAVNGCKWQDMSRNGWNSWIWLEMAGHSDLGSMGYESWGIGKNMLE